MAKVLAGVPDDRLDGPTPCPAYTLGDLLDHVGGFIIAFTAAATKTFDAEGVPQEASGDASRLPADWRVTLPAQLDGLVAAWRDPSAWTGMTRAGGVDLPAEVAGLVVLDELVVHAWDVARASGLPYTVDDPTLQAVHTFITNFAAPGEESLRDGIFGPIVEVPSESPLLDQVVALTGRNPGWTP